MDGKTPVSMLQEMCIRRGQLPHYDLIHDGGGSHEALFKYQVHVGDVSAVGSGRSKKEAKHDAAKSALKRLKDGERSSTPEPSMADEIMQVPEVTSPYQDILVANAVGALQELCLTNEMPVPEYELIGDEGPPHAKQFMMLCKVSKLEESAISRTKKQAKQQAAHRMLNRLKSSLADVLTMTPSCETDSKENVELLRDVAVSKYKELSSLAPSNRKMPIGQKISEYHLMLRNLEGDLLNRLKGEEEEMKNEIQNDPMDLLKRIMEELNLDVEVNDIESQSDQHIVLLSMSTSPESVVFGIAKTEDEACKLAAVNGLLYLRKMTV